MCFIIDCLPLFTDHSCTGTHLYVIVTVGWKSIALSVRQFTVVLYSLFTTVQSCTGGLAMAKPSVCLSVKHVHCDKTKELSVDILIPCERSIHTLYHTQNGRCGSSPSTWNFRTKWPTPFKNADLQPIFAHSASAIAPTEKSSIITSRKFTTCFLISPRWTLYVVPKPPKGGSKTQSVQNLNNKLRYLWNGMR